MDSITHSLYKAIAAANVLQKIDAREAKADQRGWDSPGPGWVKVADHTMDSLPLWSHRTVLGAAVPGDHGGGLQPLASRPQVHQVYPDADGTDLHIELDGGPDLLIFWLELTAAGLAPPAGLVTDGACVLMGPGYVEVYAVNDNARGSWVGQLCPGADGRRAEWRERTV